MLVARLAEVARAPELLVVRLDLRRELEERDPHESRQPDCEGEHDDEEVEVEEVLHSQEPEDADGRPEHPLLAVEQRRVTLEAAVLDVVQDDGHDQQRDRGDPHGPDQVAEVALVKGEEQRVEQLLGVHAARIPARASRGVSVPLGILGHLPSTLRPDVCGGGTEGWRTGLRALLSVANREGIPSLARDLLALGIEIFATDGTRDSLAADGITVGSVTDLTSEGPLAGGLVRTFHPEIYAGILARRNVPADLQSLAAQGIQLLDLVVVTVKPFAPLVGSGVVPIDEAIEMIDVAGVALLSAAARNYAGVTAACDPADYPQIVAELRSLGNVSPELRQLLAARAFAAVAAYNAEVAGYLNHINGVRFPEQLTVVMEKKRDLAYGENPHQRAAFYRETTHRTRSLADALHLHGPQPTFNDLLDLDAAYRVATDFAATTCCIVKQTNPVGLASSDSLVEAYRRALEGDPVSAFGAVVASNRTVDEPTAAEIAGNAYEAVVAPGYSEGALAILRSKEALALLAVPGTPADGMSDYGIANLDFHRIDGGLLVETLDRLEIDHSQLNVVTKRRPTLDELTDLLFAWRAVRHVSSNAIVLARHAALVGLGAGQASRMVAVEIALHRAAERSSLSVLASDAYFPFADAIQLAAERGVTAIIQPGGSVRDEMAIDVADRHHMAMVFTGRRHFRH